MSTPTSETRSLTEQQLADAISYMKLDERLGRPAYEIMRELFASAELDKTDRLRRLMRFPR